jgi:N-formylmaleamate deformylase
MPDARGHGQTPNPPEPYTAELHAADLARIIESLDLGQPVVMGHSMGAVNASLLAAHYPNRVRASILIDPPWHIRPGQRDEAGWQAWKDGLRHQQTLSDADLLEICRSNNPAWAEIDLQTWVSAKKQVDIRTFDLMNLFSVPWQAVVQRFQCPTLLVYADRSLVTQTIAQEAQSLSPHIQLLHIPDAGHSIQRDQFDLFIAGIQPFLNAL